MKAGPEYQLGQFGLYAIESMRLEKGYGHWKSDLISEFNPMESGLTQFVDLEKNFIGKTGLQHQINKGLRKSRVLITIDSDKAPAQPGESMFLNQDVVGTITSAGWGHRVKKNLAIGYLQPHLAIPGTQLSVNLVGETANATVTEGCLYDDKHQIVKGLSLPSN